MTGRIPRISNVQLDADVQTIRALKGIPDYKPHNPEFSAEAAEAAVERMEATATAVLLAENASSRRPHRVPPRPRQRPRRRHRRQGRGHRDLRLRLRSSRRRRFEEEVGSQSAETESAEAG